jgi:hypothetical protein
LCVTQATTPFTTTGANTSWRSQASTMSDFLSTRVLPTMVSTTIMLMVYIVI